MLSTSEICSDILLSKISTCDGELNTEDNPETRSNKKTHSEPKNKPNSDQDSFLSKKCNETESSGFDFQMTPKTTKENPFFRNNESILSSEGPNCVFFNENEKSEFDCLTQSKMNKDFLQNLLSQRDQLGPIKNAKMSERHILLKDRNSLAESKSEKTILLWEKDQIRDAEEKVENLELVAQNKRLLRPNFDFHRILNSPQNSQISPKIKSSKKTTGDKQVFKKKHSVSQNEKPETTSKSGNIRQPKLGDDLQDSVKNLKELGLGESRRQLELGNSQICQIKSAFLNISFKKKMLSKEDACGHSCNETCNQKVQILKKFFDGLSEDHLMSKEEVLGVLNEIFQRN